MQTPEIPHNEAARLRNLAEYSIWDSLPEAEYTEITKLASYICGTPISQLSIIGQDKQWIKAEYGSKSEGYIDRSLTVCGHAVARPDEILIVPDLRVDERFHDNPVLLNAQLAFYAGVPLVTPEGHALGTLCVLDTEPKTLNQLQIDTLKALANQVISLLELRRNKKLLEVKNQELERFAYVVAHDIKSPLNNISGLTHHFIKRYGASFTPEAMQLLKMLDNSSTQVKTLVDGILEYSRSENHITDTKQELDVTGFLQEIVQFFSYHQDCEFTIICTCPKIVANKSVLSQLLINLVSNAIKYNDKQHIQVEISFTGTPENYSFSVKDNGPGIKKEHQQNIFEMFRVFTDSDRFGKKGNGIGLATVKKLTEKLSGKIWLDSEMGKGCMFTVEFGQ